LLIYNQLKTINNFIKNNDDWSLTRNCSYFAANIWNKVSDDKLNPLSEINIIITKLYISTPEQLANSIIQVNGYKYTNLPDKNNININNNVSNSSSSILHSGNSSNSGASSSNSSYINPYSSAQYSIDVPKSSSY